jgi:hypothetical protein
MSAQKNKAATGATVAALEMLRVITAVWLLATTGGGTYRFVGNPLAGPGGGD